MVNGQFPGCLAIAVLCGCVNTDGGRENVQEYLDGFRPTVLEYASGSFVFVEGEVISAQTPRVVARLGISSCSSAPSLPTGLNLENTSCTITGTPATAQVATTYTITASNDAGSISAQISIRISTPPPSNLTYAGSPYAFVKTAPITTITPSVTGVVTSCAVSPALPGLTLNNTTCAISGSPNSSQPLTTYTITASNADGSTSTTIDLKIFRVLFNSAATVAGSAMPSSAAADAVCNGDGNRPANTGTYKAMIAGWGTRRACTSGNCVTSGASEHLDWVLAPDTEYRRNNLTTIIMTTNSAGIFAFGALTNPIGTTGNGHWTGLGTTWTTQGASGTCGGNWSTAGSTGAYGSDTTTGTRALSDPPVIGFCSSTNGRLVCAQQ